MKIIVDGFGGDNAPAEVLGGCRDAVREYGVEILVTGDEAALNKAAEQNQITLSGIQFKHAPDVLTMDDDPLDIRKGKKNCSMAVGLRTLAQGEGDAFVSAGNTGALAVGSSFLVKRIKGVRRAALAPILPSDTGCYMLLDAGANVECRPDMLAQFGVMGSVYVEKILGVSSPRVGLLNVGTEPHKGGPLQQQAYALLQTAPVNFAGNVEARDVPAGVCDVLVCDGFSGNIVLKLTEGLGMTFYGNVKEIFLKNTFSKLAALALKGGLRSFKSKMDYTEYGGAPLMGIAKPVIKAHGSSNANAFKNAIRQAKLFCENEVIREIAENLRKFSPGPSENSDSPEDGED